MKNFIPSDIDAPDNRHTNHEKTEADSPAMILDEAFEVRRATDVDVLFHDLHAGHL